MWVYVDQPLLKLFEPYMGYFNGLGTNIFESKSLALRLSGRHAMSEIQWRKVEGKLSNSTSSLCEICC